MTKQSRNNRNTFETNDAPRVEDDMDQVQDANPSMSSGSEPEKSEKVDDSPVIPCKVGTHNAIINGIRHDHGAEIEGGMSVEAIRQHRRRGVAIHCDEEGERLVRGEAPGMR